MAKRKVYPVGKFVPFCIIVWKTATACVPVTSPPATLQSTAQMISLSRREKGSVNAPKESNLPPSGVEVQRIGIMPMASEIARTRSSIFFIEKKQKQKKDTV